MNDIVLSPGVTYLSESGSGMYLPSGRIFLKKPKFGCGFTTYLLEYPERIIIVVPISEEYEKAIMSLTLNTFCYLYKKGDKVVGEAEKIIVSYDDFQDFITDNPKVNCPIVFENSEYIITSGLEYHLKVIDHLMNQPDIIFSYVLPEMGEILRKVSFLKDYSSVSILQTDPLLVSPAPVFQSPRTNRELDICLRLQRSTSRCIIVTNLSFNRIFSLTKKIIPSYDNDPDNICFYFKPGCITIPIEINSGFQDWESMFKDVFMKPPLISLDPIRSNDCPVIIVDSWSLWNFQTPPTKDVKVLLFDFFSSPKRRSFKDIFLLERVKSFSVDPITVFPSYNKENDEDRRSKSIRDTKVTISEIDKVMKKDRRDKDYNNSIKEALLDDPFKLPFINIFIDEELDDVIFKVLEFKLATRKWELGI